jgi:hypothetical protein
VLAFPSPTPSLHFRSPPVLLAFHRSDSRCANDDGSRVGGGWNHGDGYSGQSCLSSCILAGRHPLWYAPPRNPERAHPNGPRIGVYLCLFFAALPILARNNSLKNFSAATFFAGNMLIFILVSFSCGQFILLFTSPRSRF